MNIVLYGCFQNNGTPKSSILIGFSIIHLPFWGTPIFGNIHTLKKKDRASLCLETWTAGTRLAWSVEGGLRAASLDLSWWVMIGNGKSPFSIGNTASNGPFSIAMLVYQRVI